MIELLTRLRIIFGRPTKCPYCHSTDILAARGHWECYACGKEGSF